MLLDYLPQEMRTLRGEAINRLTDDEFFALCQANPNLYQGADQELSGEPVLPGFRLGLRSLRRAY